MIGITRAIYAGAPDTTNLFADDPASVVADLLERHRGAIPALRPALLTTTSHCHEGSYVEQDRPNGRGGRRSDLLDVLCRCGRKIVKHTPAAVRAGELAFCSHPNCRSEEPEVSAPKARRTQRQPAVHHVDVRRARSTAPRRCVAFLAPEIPATPSRDPRLADFPMEKFWKRIWVDGDCWVWTGAKIPAGYGQFSRRVDGRVVTMRAHRIAYEMLVGPIPLDLEIDHLCRRRACCNPAHLEAVRHSINVRRGLAPQRTREAAKRRTDYWYESGVVR